VFIKRARVSIAEKTRQQTIRLAVLSLKCTFSRVRQPTTLEPAGSSYLPRCPHRYNIFFAKTGFAARIRRLRKTRVIDAWGRFVRRKVADLGRSGREVLDSARQPCLCSCSLLMSSKDARNQCLYARLTEGFFWHPGSYNLVLAIDTAKPDRVFESRWTFALSEKDTKNCGLNIIGVLEALCDQSVKL